MSAAYLAFVSWGNDSIALVQWLREHEYSDVLCLFSDTGWAAPWWMERVEQGERLAASYGFGTARIQSMGMERLVQIKKGWPGNQYQFCTKALKIDPALEYMAKIDPDAEATCVIGVRREESRRRARFPEHLTDSPGHGGRDLWAPLVRVIEADRDSLVERAGFDVLPHRSMECSPCVNANRSDLRRLSDERVAEIEAMEKKMGYTSKGKPRVMFRPGSFHGATGIREVKRWADSSPGQYDKDQLDLLGCDSGWCGS